MYQNLKFVNVDGGIIADHFDREGQIYFDPGSTGHMAALNGDYGPIAPYVEPEPEPPPPPLTRLYKSSLIRRMSPSEAETFESVLLTETAYVRMLYNSVEWFDMSDALVSYMHFVFVGIVGEERADELLAPEI